MPGETPERALIREIKEETGLEVDIVRKCGSIPLLMPLLRQRMFSFARSTREKRASHLKRKRIAWHPLSRLPSLFSHRSPSG